MRIRSAAAVWSLLNSLSLFLWETEGEICQKKTEGFLEQKQPLWSRIQSTCNKSVIRRENGNNKET